MKSGDQLTMTADAVIDLSPLAAASVSGSVLLTGDGVAGVLDIAGDVDFDIVLDQRRRQHRVQLLLRREERPRFYDVAAKQPSPRRCRRACRPARPASSSAARSTWAGLQAQRLGRDREQRRQARDHVRRPASGLLRHDHVRRRRLTAEIYKGRRRPRARPGRRQRHLRVRPAVRDHGLGHLPPREHARRRRPAQRQPIAGGTTEFNVGSASPVVLFEEIKLAQARPASRSSRAAAGTSSRPWPSTSASPSSAGAFPLTRPANRRSTWPGRSTSAAAAWDLRHRRDPRPLPRVQRRRQGRARAGRHEGLGRQRQLRRQDHRHHAVRPHRQLRVRRRHRRADGRGVQINLLVATINECAKFTIGFFKVLPPVYLAGLRAPPRTRSRAGTGSRTPPGPAALHLNVGDRGGYRNLAGTTTDEFYYVSLADDQSDAAAGRRT